MIALDKYKSTSKRVSLYKIVDDMMIPCRNIITTRKIFFINNIPKKLSIPEALVAGLMVDFQKLLYSHADKNCLRIFVEDEQEMVTLNLKSQDITGFRFSAIKNAKQ